MGNNTRALLSADLLHVGSRSLAKHIRAQLVPRNASVGGLLDRSAASGRHLKTTVAPLPNEALGRIDQLAKCGLTTSNVDGFSDRLGIHAVDTSSASRRDTSPTSGSRSSLPIALLV